MDVPSNSKEVEHDSLWRLVGQPTHSRPVEELRGWMKDVIGAVKPALTLAAVVALSFSLGDSWCVEEMVVRINWRDACERVVAAHHRLM